MKESFILYTEQAEIINELTDEQAGQLLKAIYKYANGEETELAGITKLAFIPIRQQIDRNAEKYEAFKEKQAENGKRGGRPKKLENPKNPTLLKENPKNPTVFSKTQKSLNVNVNVNDNDNVSLPPISPKNENEGKEEKKEDIFFHPIIEKFRKEYTFIFQNSPPLLKAQREKILELHRELEDFEETIPEVLTALKNLNFEQVGYKPNLIWLLKDDNYLRLKLGEFTAKKEKSIIDYMYSDEELQEDG